MLTWETTVHDVVCLQSDHDHTSILEVAAVIIMKKYKVKWGTKSDTNALQ